MNTSFETIKLESAAEDEEVTVLGENDGNLPSVFEEHADRKRCAKCVSEHRVFLPSKKVDDDVIRGVDKIHRLVTRKKRWIRNAERDYRDGPEMKEFHQEVDNLKESGSMLVPESVISFMREAEDFPDTYFSGSYNWYYTGGSLKCLNLDTMNNKLLLYTSGKKRQFLRVATVSCDPFWHADTANVKKATPKEKSEIFQVEGVCQGGLAFVGARQKNTCSFYLVDNTTKCKECIVCESHIPFTGLDVNPAVHQCCTINIKGGMEIWDVSERRLVRSHNANDPSLNWVNIHYSADQPSVAVATSQMSINFFDHRAKKIKTSCLMEDLKPFSRKEKISLTLSSVQRPNIIYVATSCNIMLLDKRNMKLPLHRWFHCMKTPPVFGSVVDLKYDIQAVCFGSTYPGSVVIAQSSDHMAYPLLEAPSISESLLSYNSQGRCLEPSLESRVVHSLVGLTHLSFNRSKKFDMLMQTSAGDVLSQTVSKNPVNCKNVQDFSSLSLYPKSLNCTDTRNMTHIYDGICNKALNVKKRTTNSITPQIWQRTKEELFSYRDILSPIILDIWDIELEDNSQSLKEATEEIVPVEEKVKSWLEDDCCMIVDNEL